jgi:hypothetical protein
MQEHAASAVVLACLLGPLAAAHGQQPTKAAPPAADAAPNTVRLHGALMDGSPGDLANLQRAYDATPSGGTIEVPAGRWPVNNLGWALPIKTQPGKHVFWKFLGPVDAGPTAAPGTNPLTALGDGDVTESYGRGNLVFSRRLLTGADESNDGVAINLENHNPSFRPYAYGSGPDIPALRINAASFPGSTGQLNGLWITLHSGGNNPFTSEEQGLNVIVRKTGQNSTWQISGLTTDETGTPPQAFASIAQELDIVANGPDDPASLYDGHKGNRVFAYYAAKVFPFAAYEPGKAYPAGAKVAAVASDGVKSVYIAGNAGTAGAKPPAWPTGGAVTDNGIVWTYGEPFDVTIGRGIWFDGGRDKPDAPQVKYGALFSSNARLQNAAIDLSQTVLDTAHSAAIRLGSNQPIDFSGNGTAAGQNQRVLEYSTTAKSLTYAVQGVPALSIADSGLASFPGQIQAPLATPKSSSAPCVAGTRTADANYDYVCVATNKWKRAALSDF